MEFNGMFGFETISTRLLKQFGGENMLEAFSKRNGDLPCPGKEVSSIEVAKKQSQKDAQMGTYASDFIHLIF